MKCIYIVRIAGLVFGRITKDSKSYANSHVGVTFGYFKCVRCFSDDGLFKDYYL